jgi:hypothetical protein
MSLFVRTYLLKNNPESDNINRDSCSKNISKSDTINRDRCSQNNFDSDTVDGVKTNSDSDIIARDKDKCPQNNSDSDITARCRCPQTQLTLI